MNNTYDENEIIDLNLMLKPLSEQFPAGTDLRLNTLANSLYYQIRDARSRARLIERQFLQGEVNSQSITDWEIVYDLSVEALSFHSKDIEICSWLIEALLRKYEFKGLHLGFKLAQLLIENFWDGLFPREDEDGVFTKISSLATLSGIDNEGTLLPPLAYTYITLGSTHGPYQFWQYLKVLNLEKTADFELKKKRESESNISLKQIEIAVAETDSSFFINLDNNLSKSIFALQSLNTTLQNYCGNETPCLSKILKLLDEFKKYLHILARHKLTPTLIEATKTANPRSSSSEYDFQLNESLNRITAMKCLLSIADFFRTNEPHSPLPYLLERAVAWGKLPLHELLKELIHNENERKQIFRLTGIE